MIELNRSLVDTYLDEAVAEFGGDYVYSKSDTGSCNYVRDGAPSCLVGQVLAKAGVPLDRLVVADQGQYGGGVPADDLLAELVEEGVLRYDGEAITLLSVAQHRQDSGSPWAAAVRAARNAL
jgi:hypothetical protein